MDAKAELEKRRVPTSLEDLEQLRSTVDQHLERVRSVDYEFVQVDVAERLAANFIAVIDEPGALDEPGRATVAAAVGYFVSAKDAEDDLTSPIGLEDDVFVANEAFAQIGRTDLTVSVLEP